MGLGIFGNQPLFELLVDQTRAPAEQTILTCMFVRLGFRYNSEVRHYFMPGNSNDEQS